MGLRRPTSVSLAVLGMVLASGLGAEAEAQCSLEQRLSPWRVSCHTPLHSVPTVNVGAPVTDNSLSQAAVLSMFGRSRSPIDRDNGEVWAGRGLSFALAAGVGGSFGPLRFSVFPTVHWAQNADFAVTDLLERNYSPYIYPWDGRTIDWAQRMGPASHGGITSGQSFVELAGWSQSALGLSSENIWWGPSNRYPMLLGATSGGVPHVYAHSPVVTVGPLLASANLVFGRPSESDYFDAAEANDLDLLGALRVEIALKSVPSARIAVTSMTRQPWRSDLSLDDLLKLVPRSTSQEPGESVDGIGAVTVIMPVGPGKGRLHGTWGRGDFFLDIEDLLTEPDHNQFWSVGFHRTWSSAVDLSEWMMSVEYASSAASVTQNSTAVRGPTGSTVYRHEGSPQHGHTQRGQLLGPSIGPGARAGYMSLDRTEAGRLDGFLVERILWDIDAFSRQIKKNFPDGQDREWLFAGRVSRTINISGIDPLRLDATGGVSLRWNRQYVRFTGSLLDKPSRETNLWVDLRFSWVPRHEASSN
ncbi:MAG: hypothetical protein O2992_00235 [Gemmatimonadetes bacterium]|nr:hypothetical protein [Gemmatimonadota bacterium]